jgi:hypothetical protein
MPSFADTWVSDAKMEAWYRSQFARAVFNEFLEFPGAAIVFDEDDHHLSKKGTPMSVWRISLRMPSGARHEIAHHIALTLASRYGGPPRKVVSRNYRTNHEFVYGGEGGAETFSVPLGEL